MRASTPIDIGRLELELEYHPDRKFVDHLVSGLRFGFDTGITDPPGTPYICKNLQSALAQPQLVSELLQHELHMGYLLGPFDSPPFDVYRISPIGLAERKYSKKYRLIVDLSAPHNNAVHASINSLIDKNEYSLSYIGVDDCNFRY